MTAASIGVSDRERMPGWVVGMVLASLAFGVIVRFACPGDMEWKGDEIYSVVEARQILETHVWPVTGMGSSVGLPNPGLSLWAFVPLVAIGKTPIGVCLLVMLMNTAALLGFAAVAIFAESAGADAATECRRPLAARFAARESWLWAMGLMAVNPYVVRISRKIWPPSLLLPLVLLLYVGRARRGTRLGAFAWGLAGAAIGQIHLSGFFLAGGILIQTLVDRFQRRDQVAIRWVWWITGSCCGAVALIPWILALREPRQANPVLGWSLGSIYHRITDFYWLWAELALGHTAWFSYTGQLDRLLALPRVAGKPTHLIRLFYNLLYWIGLLSIGSWAAGKIASALPDRWTRQLARSLRQLRRRIQGAAAEPWERMIRTVWLHTHRVLTPNPNRPIACDAESRFYGNATVLWGAALTILTCPIMRVHYAYAFIPFIFVWLATVFARRRRLLAAVLAIQAVLTLAILIDVHGQGGVITGDYGRTYRAQGH